MKTLTIQLDDNIYQAVVAHSQRTGRTVADVVRDALQSVPGRGTGTHSLRDFKPLGLRLRRPDGWKSDDILGEMIHHDDDNVE